MNSLEFINKEIENLKSFLELDDVLCDLSNNDYKLCKDRLQTLEQIKDELIVWKVAKKVLSHFDESLIEGLLIGLCNSSEVDINEYNNFKKALEVENDIKHI